MIARYTRPPLAALWSDAHRYDTWLRVELARAAGKLDPARILEHEERTKHDVIAFLTHIEELAGEPARWLHLGMTSSDVLDTALALQTTRALDAILAGLDLLRAALRRRAEEHRNTFAI